MFYMLVNMIMMINTILFTQMTHPMSMGMILLIQTLMICLISGTMKIFWFSYILFLIFIGGMLILFIYMSSLSPNEKINFSINKNMKFITLTLLLLLFIFIDNFFLTPQSFNSDSNSFSFNTPLKENLLSLSKIYDYPNSFITLMMILYLLLTLIVIVKISNSFMGPLRSKN